MSDKPLSNSFLLFWPVAQMTLSKLLKASHIFCYLMSPTMKETFFGCCLNFGEDFNMHVFQGQRTQNKGEMEKLKRV